FRNYLHNFVEKRDLNRHLQHFLHYLVLFLLFLKHLLNLEVFLFYYGNNKSHSGLDHIICVLIIY
ncbi:MAG TPA: hypothetical protein VHJ38_14945, partial [Nitrososphaeraceae archaeon]|nr:hypothetical protein [Nitrososphaeraceae archaeon]